ncbi:cytochrome c-type biogenesis protein CcmF [Armatimonadetes bacterium DC]|nr:cytochrome c-type biogenesis protein CcmF [Armatimonadetes bacterium DC]
MLLGYLVVWLGCAFALGAVVAYALSGRKPHLIRWGRGLFWGAFLMILATEAVLQYALITGRYDLQYVFSFSERSLHLWYKIAGAWAGQEGSFLLWAIWTGIYGLVLMRTAGGYERWVMTLYSGLVLALMGILAYQSPFAPLPKPDPAPAVWPPQDGFGLNPSLENIWMTIHPPIIFAGFAALAVPFMYALAALWRNEYYEWAIRVRPWAIYATTMLGFGLVLGGYWAYETLGWGGFWAWDPVENTSYFPWLLMAAGVHGVMLQINRGRMVRWNPLLLAIPFLLFVYGTFLTRSGVLAEVSVHSFDALTKSALGILIGMLAGGVLVTLGLWLYRYRQMPLPAPDMTKGFSREAALRWGIALLSISALISLVGTSWPLIAKLFRGQAAALQPEFYNQVHIPWIILTAIVAAAAPMLGWRGMTLDQILERLTKSWVLAVLTGFAAFWYGFREPLTLFIVVLLAFVAFANLGAIWRRAQVGKGKGWQAWLRPAAYGQALAGLWQARYSMGGFLTHFGLAVGLIGLILSYAYEVKQQVVVEQGRDTIAFGYRWRYLGMTGNEKFPGDPMRDKFNRVRIEVASHDTKFIVEPRFYQFQRGGEVSNVVWPHIVRWWDHDLYVSFFAPPQVSADPLTLRLHEKEKGKVGDYTIEFKGFETAGAMGQEGFRAIAVARVSHPRWRESVEVAPFRLMDRSGIIPIPVPLPDGAQILVGQMDVSRRLVEFQLIMVPGKPETNPRWVIPLEVYYKPFTILVWLGPPLTLLGGLLAVVRRARAVREGVRKLTPEWDDTAPSLAQEQARVVL